MKNLFKIAAIVALVSTFSFAQEVESQELKLGVRANFNLNLMSLTYTYTGSGNTYTYGSYDLGIGGGAGLIAVLPLPLPIEGFDIGLRGGVEFGYRQPYTTSLTTYSELAVTVPVLVQYSAQGQAGVPVWAAVGIQLDVPLMSGSSYDGGDKVDDKDRAAVDISIAAAAGYDLTPNFTVDVKWNMILNNFSKDFADPFGGLFSGLKWSWMYQQIQLGVAYFF